MFCIFGRTSCLFTCLQCSVFFQAAEDARSFSLAVHDALPMYDAHHQLHLPDGRLHLLPAVLIGVLVLKVSQIEWPNYSSGQYGPQIVNRQSSLFLKQFDPVHA